MFVPVIKKKWLIFMISAEVGGNYAKCIFCNERKIIIFCRRFICKKKLEMRII